MSYLYCLKIDYTVVGEVMNFEELHFDPPYIW